MFTKYAWNWTTRLSKTRK